jgi:hypothetical protein
LLGSIQSISSTLAGALIGLFSKGGVHTMAMLMLAFAIAMWLAQRAMASRQ